MHKINKIIIGVLVVVITLSASVAVAGVSDWVKILNKINSDFTIEQADEVECLGVAGGYFGCTNYTAKTITIESDQPQSRQDNTFAHELGHILFDNDPRAQLIFSSAESLIPPGAKHRGWKENAAYHMERWMAGKAGNTKAYQYITYKITLNLLKD